LTKLHQEKVRQQNYQSKHEYSLEEFGLSAQEVYNELSDVMEEFGFEKEF
jgi:DNA-binding HxlR family transcriptional regulator